MTLPDLTPEEPGTGTRREKAVEGVIIALIVLVAGSLGLPSLVEALREGSVELATVFYPVMLVAVVALAWNRRAGS
jgi:uncharacterized membrane protein